MLLNNKAYTYSFISQNYYYLSDIFKASTNLASSFIIKSNKKIQPAVNLLFKIINIIKLKKTKKIVVKAKSIIFLTK